MKMWGKVGRAKKKNYILDKDQRNWLQIDGRQTAW